MNIKDKKVSEVTRKELEEYLKNLEPTAAAEDAPEDDVPNGGEEKAAEPSEDIAADKDQAEEDKKDIPTEDKDDADGEDGKEEEPQAPPAAPTAPPQADALTQESVSEIINKAIEPVLASFAAITARIEGIERSPKQANDVETTKLDELKRKYEN